jgi:hypothetical protein
MLIYMLSGIVILVHIAVFLLVKILKKRLYVWLLILLIVLIPVNVVMFGFLIYLHNHGGIFNFFK